MWGKPPKLTTFAKRSRQVAGVLSQPAVIVNASPTCIGRGIGRKSESRELGLPCECDFTSISRPALSPLLHVILPRLNTPDANEPIPLAVKSKLLMTLAIVPLP